jgi:hypothetical protein
VNLPDFVQWDRGVVGDQRTIIYGWIRRSDGARDFAIIEFDHSTGLPSWWLTSSAKYSKVLHEWCGGKAEEHVDCVPFQEAMRRALGLPMEAT